MDKRRTSRIAVAASSGNVFSDLGFPEPEEELAKAELLKHIQQTIRRRRLSQKAAAVLMGVDQPKVSALVNGRCANFSSGRLMKLLIRLGQDVEVTIRPAPQGRGRGRLRVRAEARV